MSARCESHLPLMSLGAQQALQPFIKPRLVVHKKYSSHGALISWEQSPGFIGSASAGLQRLPECSSALSANHFYLSAGTQCASAPPEGLLPPGTRRAYASIRFYRQNLSIS